MENPIVNIVVIELDWFLGVSISDEEFKIKVATNHLVGNFGILSIIDFHAVCISQKDDMEIARGSVSSHVHGVSAICLMVDCSTIDSCSIGSPDCVVSRV